MTSHGHHRAVAIAGVFLAVLALGGVVLLGMERETIGDGLKTVEEIAAQQGEVIRDLAEDSEELRQQLQDAGIEPSAPPPEERTDDLPDTPGEPVSPTDAQVEAAVEVVLEENPDLLTSQVIAEVARYLTANPPPPGEPGADATDAMAFQAVVAFCIQPDEPCRGNDGLDGADGADAVLTQAMVEAALADFCSTNPDACQSTVPGPTGDTGATGRGLVSIDCVDGVLIATYDQAPTTQLIAGTTCQFPPGQGGKAD
jgi:hypothetical protein